MDPKVIRKMINEFYIAKAKIVLELNYEQYEHKKHLRRLKGLKKKTMKFNPYKINFDNIESCEILLSLDRKLDALHSGRDDNGPEVSRHIQHFRNKVKQTAKE